MHFYAKNRVIMTLSASLLFAPLQGKSIGALAQEYPDLGKSILGNKAFNASSSNITSLEGIETIPGIRSAYAISLKDNPLGILKENSFNFPQLSNIIWLDLRHANLAEIEPGAFNGLENLRVLLLNDNQLSQLKDGVLNNLTKLTFLTVGGNQQQEKLRKDAKKSVPGVFVTSQRITPKFIGQTIGALAIAAGTAAAIWYFYPRGPVIGKPTDFKKESEGPLLGTIPLEEAQEREAQRRKGEQTLKRKPEEEPDEVTIRGMGLYAAVEAANYELATKLLDAKADINRKYTVAERTPLMAAAVYGNERMARLLLKAGAAKDLTDRAGNTAADLARKSPYFSTGGPGYKKILALLEGPELEGTEAEEEK